MTRPPFPTEGSGAEVVASLDRAELEALRTEVAVLRARPAIDVERMAWALHRAGCMCWMPISQCQDRWIGDERMDVHSGWARLIAREYEALAKSGKRGEPGVVG